MTEYIGTKRIEALPMNRAEYNKYRGWQLPAGENGADEGWLVEYLDGGASNHPSHAGYISWSPAGVFERAYRSTAAMTFGDAIVMLKAGKRVARAGWNGKGMWLSLMQPEEVSDMTRPYVYMKTVDEQFVPWVASQTDMLAEDWMVV